MVDQWILGAVICVVANVGVNFGMNMMKLAYSQRDLIAERIYSGDIPEQAVPPVWKFWPWRLGSLSFVIGNLGNFVSLGLAAQSLLAALTSVQFVANVLFAVIIHKQKVKLHVILATTCIVAGNVLLVSFANKESVAYSINELIGMYTALPYLLFLGAIATVSPAAFVVYRTIYKRALQDPQSLSPVGNMLLPISFALYAALPGSQVVFLSKSLAVIAAAWVFDGVNPFISWYPYVVGLALSTVGVFWVTRLDQGIQLFDPVTIIPVLLLMWSVFSVVSGGLYFQEFNSFSTLQIAMFSTGLATILTGVYLLVPSRPSVEQEPSLKGHSGDGDSVPAAHATGSPRHLSLTEMYLEALEVESVCSASVHNSPRQADGSFVLAIPDVQTSPSEPTPTLRMRPNTPTTPTSAEQQLEHSLGVGVTLTIEDGTRLPESPSAVFPAKKVAAMLLERNAGRPPRRTCINASPPNSPASPTASAGRLSMLHNTRRTIVQTVGETARLSVGLGTRKSTHALSVFGLPMIPLESSDGQQPQPQGLSRSVSTAPDAMPGPQGPGRRAA